MKGHFLIQFGLFLCHLKKNQKYLKFLIFYLDICLIIFLYNFKYLHMNNLFRALNDPTRREILELLKEKDLTAGEIADNFEMSKPSISHHLDLLKQAELILAVKKGQFINYSLNMTVMDEVMAWFMTFKPVVQEALEPLVKPKIRIQLNTNS